MTTVIINLFHQSNSFLCLLCLLLPLESFRVSYPLPLLILLIFLPPHLFFSYLSCFNFPLPVHCRQSLFLSFNSTNSPHQTLLHYLLLLLFLLHFPAQAIKNCFWV